MEDLDAVTKRHMRVRGMSLRGLAKAVPCDPTYLSRVLRGIQPCGPKLARDIDNVLQAGGEIVRAAATSEKRTGSSRASAAEAAEVMAWVTATNASDDAIEELAQNAEYLAGAHARMPAPKVLDEVLSVHRAVRAVLRGGRQRLA